MAPALFRPTMGCAMSAPTRTGLNRDYYSIVQWNTSKGSTLPPYGDTRTLREAVAPAHLLALAQVTQPACTQGSPVPLAKPSALVYRSLFA